MNTHPDWPEQRVRIHALLSLSRDELSEAEWVRRMRELDVTGDWYEGYVAGLTPRKGGTQATLI